MYKLLTVDDDENITSLVCNLAEQVGFVAESATGENVNNIYKNFQAHVVVLDIFMPGNDGFETLSLLEQYDNKPSLIILSVGDLAYHQSISLLAKTKNFHVRATIQKPFEADSLKQTLQETYTSLSKQLKT